MKFTLIMATLNRNAELIPLLNSLQNQSYKDFELIIIDQNDNDLIQNVCQPYSFNKKIIKSEIKGLSVNRNIGMQYISGDITAFPDDDCEYETSTLEKVKLFLDNNPNYNFYTCNTKDKENNLSITSTKSNNSNISVLNVMRTGISFTIFVRSNALKSFKFDEKLGIGAKFGSGEESDLLFYLLKHGSKGYYFAGNYVYHSAKIAAVDRAYPYGKGFGAVFKKAITVYRFYVLLPVFLLYIIKSIIRIIISKDKTSRLATLRGRITGFIQYK